MKNIIISSHVKYNNVYVFLNYERDINNEN